MFRRTHFALGISPFSLFIKESAGMPAFKGLSVPERGKKLGEMFRLLGPSEKRALQDRASKVVRNQHYQQRTKSVKVQRGASPYNTFVSKEMAKLAAAGSTLPFGGRMKEIAKKWNDRKK